MILQEVENQRENNLLKSMQAVGKTCQGKQILII
jgi:hypothetical protein